MYIICATTWRKEVCFIFIFGGPTIIGSLRFEFLPRNQMQACCHSLIAMAVENMKENMINFVL
jgi:hypothetical protein